MAFRSGVVGSADSDASLLSVLLVDAAEVLWPLAILKELKESKVAITTELMKGNGEFLVLREGAILVRRFVRHQEPSHLGCDGQAFPCG